MIDDDVARAQPNCGTSTTGAMMMMMMMMRMTKGSHFQEGERTKGGGVSSSHGR